jgi:AraC family transcriptional regulator
LPGAETPSIVATIAKAWACEPEEAASGSPVSGLHLSRLSGRGGAEASAKADPAYHTICFPLMRYRSEFTLDQSWSRAAKVEAGQLCFVPAGRAPWGVNIGAWRSLHIYLPDKIIVDTFAADGFALDLKDLWAPAPKAFREPGIEQVCRALHAEMVAHEAFSRLRIDCLAQDLAIQLLRTQTNRPGLAAAGPSKGGLTPRQLQRALDAMAEQPLGIVSLSELAQAAGYSPSYFSRAFKRSTGKTLSVWQRQNRIRRAEALLADTTMSLAEIALALGFSAQSHFTTAFRRESGLSPGAWRTQRVR